MKYRDCTCLQSNDPTKGITTPGRHRQSPQWQTHFSDTASKPPVSTPLHERALTRFARPDLHVPLEAMPVIRDDASCSINEVGLEAQERERHEHQRLFRHSLERAEAGHRLRRYRGQLVGLAHGRAAASGPARRGYQRLERHVQRTKTTARRLAGVKKKEGEETGSS